MTAAIIGSVASLLPTTMALAGIPGELIKDVERKKQKEPNVYRILGLGNSFAFGVVPLIPKGTGMGPLQGPREAKPQNDKIVA